MTAYAMGIDFGSTTAKVVILNEDGDVVASTISHKGAVSDEGVRIALQEALTAANVQISDVGRVTSTGYGRRMLDIADRTVTEITCHARGAVALVPEARVVIDIGGQDSKVIAIDAKGLVARFAMNDRCAAGTGKYFEVLARAMGMELDQLGPTALEADEAVEITSMCATFAETEVISLLAEGRPKPTILAGVHRSIANRTVGLVGRVGKRDPIVMTGGVSRNVAAVHFLEEALKTKMIIPPNAQNAGALGAALFALDDLRQQGSARRQNEEDVESKLEQLLSEGMPCVPACASTGGKGIPTVIKAVH